MTKNKKIALYTVLTLLFIDIGFGMYQKFSDDIYFSNSDEKIIQSVKKSLQFIDSFYKEKGFYPCAEDFYINFWNKEFREPEYNIDYRPFDDYPECDYKDEPRKFISLCYNLSKESPLAFGYKYYKPSVLGWGASLNYCVTSPETSFTDYPDYREFLGY